MNYFDKVYFVYSNKISNIHIFTYLNDILMTDQVPSYKWRDYSLVVLRKFLSRNLECSQLNLFKDLKNKQNPTVKVKSCKNNQNINKIYRHLLHFYL